MMELLARGFVWNREEEGREREREREREVRNEDHVGEGILIGFTRSRRTIDILVMAVIEGGSHAFRLYAALRNWRTMRKRIIVVRSL